MAPNVVAVPPGRFPEPNPDQQDLPNRFDLATFGSKNRDS
jgi:hypothetical protein